MRNKLSWFAVPYVVWMALMVVIPILIMVVYAFTTAEFQGTLENFAEMGAYASVFFRSFRLAFIATLVCLLIGYPVSYWMAHEGPGFQRVAMALIMLPMWMNFLLRTYSWMSILENNGLLNQFFRAIGLLDLLGVEYIPMIGTPGAVVLGMVYNYLPFMILPIYNVMAKIDDNTINAAKDLGASEFQTLIHVWLPLSLPGIISGITMVFVPALTTFVISNLLGGSKILLIGNVIEQEFTRGNNWNLGAGLSLVLMLFILLSMALIAKYDKDGEGAAF